MMMLSRAGAVSAAAVVLGLIPAGAAHADGAYVCADGSLQSGGSFSCAFHGGTIADAQRKAARDAQFAQDQAQRKAARDAQDAAEQAARDAVDDARRADQGSNLDRFLRNTEPLGGVRTVPTTDPATDETVADETEDDGSAVAVWLLVAAVGVGCLVVALLGRSGWTRKPPPR